LKIIPNAWGRKAVLKLMFGAMIRASERWRAIKTSNFERRQLTALREEVDKEYDVRIGLVKEASTEKVQTNLSSKNRT
jgi:putative transposase